MPVPIENLPYFLALLKKNVLLCSIIVHGSVAQIDLSHIKHVTHGDSLVNAMDNAAAIDLLDFSLSEEEKFPSVNVLILDETVEITFHTTSSDYYDHPERYFGRSGVERFSQPYTIFGVEDNTREKNLGNFEFLGPNFTPASVWLRQSSAYGYVISVSFYSFNRPPAQRKE